MNQTADSNYPEWFNSRTRTKDLIVSPAVPWLMVGLPVLVLVAIVIYPTIWMGYHAFHDTNMMSLFHNNYEYVGWDNFYNVLTAERMHAFACARIYIYVYIYIYVHVACASAFVFGVCLHV